MTHIDKTGKACKTQHVSCLSNEDLKLYIPNTESFKLNTGLLPLDTCPRSPLLNKQSSLQINPIFNPKFKGSVCETLNERGDRAKLNVGIKITDELSHEFRLVNIYKIDPLIYLTPPFTLSLLPGKEDESGNLFDGSYYLIFAPKLQIIF